MATKSVIEIDVLDEKFQKFKAEFDKFRDALASIPKDIDNVNSRWSKGIPDNDKVNKKIQDMGKALKDTGNEFKNIALSTGKIALNLASGAISIAKWLALGSLFTGFGLGKLAESTSDVRKRAQGLGITTGELRAADVNFSRYLDVQGTLSNIADIRSDLSRRQIINRLAGGNTEGKDIAQLLPSIIRGAITQFKAGGQTQQYAEALGLTQVFSLEELRRLSSLNEQELKKTISDYEKDRQSLAIDDAASYAWQNFWIQLKRSGNSIETSLIKGLEPLTPQLEKFSKVMAGLIDDFFKNHDVKKLIDDLATRIKDFVTYLGSKQFKQDFNDFLTNVGKVKTALGILVDSVIWTANFLKNPSKWFSENAEKTANTPIVIQKTTEPNEIIKKLAEWGIIPTSQELFGKNKSLAERNFNPGNLKYVGQQGATLGAGGFAKFANDQAGLQALATQLNLYDTGKSKAAGYKKIDTIADIIKLYAPVGAENSAESVKNYIALASKSAGVGANEHIDFSKNPETLYALISAISKMESGKDRFTPAQVKVLVQNNTGGNAIATAHALPGGQGS